jgi:hypothetical protein
MTTGHLTPPAHLTRRDELRTQANWAFVNVYEFRRLAVSNRRLIRADAPEAALRGLLDEATGMRFVIEEENLFPVG